MTMSNLTSFVMGEVTMSSLEISEYTGKKHSHVIRDIKKMLSELYGDDPKMGHPKNSINSMHDGVFVEADSRGYVGRFIIDRKHTDCLLTGYSAKARMNVIKRWHELEKSNKPSIPQTYAEALQLAADQAKQIELAAPKVAFVDNLVDRTNLMNATQVAQKHGKSAIWLNKHLSEYGVYNRSIKRTKAFQQWFVDSGYGEMKKNEMGYDQPLFTNAGEVWINEKLYSEGLV